MAGSLTERLVEEFLKEKEAFLRRDIKIANGRDENPALQRLIEAIKKGTIRIPDATLAEYRKKFNYTRQMPKIENLDPGRKSQAAAALFEAAEGSRMSIDFLHDAGVVPPALDAKAKVLSCAEKVSLSNIMHINQSVFGKGKQGRKLYEAMTSNGVLHPDTIEIMRNAAQAIHTHLSKQGTVNPELRDTLMHMDNFLARHDATPLPVQREKKSTGRRKHIIYRR